MTNFVENFFYYSYDSQKLLANFSFYFYEEYKKNKRNIKIISERVSKKTKWNTTYIRKLFNNLYNIGHIRISKNVDTAEDEVHIISEEHFNNYIERNKDLELHEREQQKFLDKWTPVFKEFFQKGLKGKPPLFEAHPITCVYREMMKDENYKNNAGFCLHVLTQYQIFNFFDEVRAFATIQKNNKLQVILQIDNLQTFKDLYVGSDPYPKKARKSVA